MALQSTGCGRLVSTEKSQPGLGKNGGGVGRENSFGGLGLVVPGGAGLLVFISASPGGQDHCSSLLLHPHHGPYPIPSSWLCPSLPAHLPPTSSLLCPPWKASLPSPFLGTFAAVPPRCPHFYPGPTSPHWIQLSRGTKRLAANAVQPSRRQPS